MLSKHINKHTKKFYFAIMLDKRNVLSFVQNCHTVEDFKAVGLMQGEQFGNISKEKFALDHLSKQLMGS